MAAIVWLNRITITGLVITILVTQYSSAKKSDIITTTRGPWTPLGYFATVLNVSFGSSKCCNVLMSGESAGSEVFNEFVKTYRYDYTLNNMAYDCDNFFIIIASMRDLLTTMENVQEKNSVSKILITVVGHDKELTGLFNVSIYGSANVNIVTYNGVWSLSENFLVPRVFKKISRPHEMQRYGPKIVNLRGRQLQAMTYFNPPFCYLKSTINRTVNGVAGEYFIAMNQSELDGVEMKLFMLIAEQLNFSWVIRSPTTNDRFGHEDGNKWVGGMMGQVIENRADFAFSCMWLTKDKYQYANPTQPWTTVFIHFLVPRPKPYTSFWALTRPFSPTVWIAVSVIIVLLSIYVYTRAWIVPKTSRRFRSFATTWTELLGRLVGTWAPPRMRGFELHFQTWHFIGILLVTAYSSSLSARLANAHYEKRIDTLEDFVGANLSWGWKGEIPTFTTMFDYSDPYAQQVIARYERNYNYDDMDREISRRNFAVLGNIIGSNFFPKRITDTANFADLRVMKTPIAQFQTTFIVQPWLVQSVDTVMLRMQELGLVQYHLKDVLRRCTARSLREVMKEHDHYVEGAKVLQLNPLGAGFAMLAIGLCISTVVFCHELSNSQKN